MIIQNVTQKQERELTAPIIKDLSFVFGKISQDMIERIKTAKTPQEAMEAINVLDEVENGRS